MLRMTGQAGRWLLTAAATGALLLTGVACSLRAPYKAPDTKPAALREADAATFALAPYDPAWWNEFEDPVLDTLVRASLSANLDVRAAVARLDQARSVFDDRKLDRFPIVTVGASVDRREQSVPGFSEEPLDTTTYRAGFDAF